MPGKARIDVTGALHHLVVCGIERQAIFRDDLDKNRFLLRLGRLLEESGTICYAWAILLKPRPSPCLTGIVPVATFMGRLLTGYAVSFNRRYKSTGIFFRTDTHRPPAKKIPTSWNWSCTFI